MSDRRLSKKHIRDMDEKQLELYYARKARKYQKKIKQMESYEMYGGDFSDSITGVIYKNGTIYTRNKIDEIFKPEAVVNSISKFPDRKNSDVFWQTYISDSVPDINKHYHLPIPLRSCMYDLRGHRFLTGERPTEQGGGTDIFDDLQVFPGEILHPEELKKQEKHKEKVRQDLDQIEKKQKEEQKEKEEQDKQQLEIKQTMTEINPEAGLEEKDPLILVSGLAYHAFQEMLESLQELHYFQSKATIQKRIPYLSPSQQQAIVKFRHMVFEEKNIIAQVRQFQATTQNHATNQVSSLQGFTHQNLLVQSPQETNFERYLEDFYQEFEQLTLQSTSGKSVAFFDDYVIKSYQDWEIFFIKYFIGFSPKALEFQKKRKQIEKTANKDLKDLLINEYERMVHPDITDDELIRKQGKREYKTSKKSTDLPEREYEPYWGKEFNTFKNPNRKFYYLGPSLAVKGRPLSKNHLGNPFQYQEETVFRNYRVFRGVSTLQVLYRTNNLSEIQKNLQKYFNLLESTNSKEYKALQSAIEENENISQGDRGLIVQRLKSIVRSNADYIEQLVDSEEKDSEKESEKDETNVVKLSLSKDSTFWKLPLTDEKHLIYRSQLCSYKKHGNGKVTEKFSYERPSVLSINTNNYLTTPIVFDNYQTRETTPLAEEKIRNTGPHMDQAAALEPFIQELDDCFKSDFDLKKRNQTYLEREEKNELNTLTPSSELSTKQGHLILLGSDLSDKKKNTTPMISHYNMKSSGTSMMVYVSPGKTIQESKTTFFWNYEFDQHQETYQTDKFTSAIYKEVSALKQMRENQQKGVVSAIFSGLKAMSATITKPATRDLIRDLKRIVEESE